MRTRMVCFHDNSPHTSTKSIHNGKMLITNVHLPSVCLHQLMRHKMHAEVTEREEKNYIYLL